MTEPHAAFDWVIRGGRLVDGTGKRAPYRADVGVTGDRISAVGAIREPCPGRVIDASGRVVSPGFIDVHVHGELMLRGSQDQLAPAWQGVTTQLMSPDGFGWAPLPPQQAAALCRYTQFIHGRGELGIDASTVESYLSAFAGQIPINLCPQIPHAAVRVGAMGWDARPATPRELEAMVAAAHQWMAAGASGLCVGLDYQPGAHAHQDELVALARVAAEYGGIYAAHIRKQILGTRGAWEETFDIARRSGAPVHISHEVVSPDTAPLFDRADSDDIDLSFDAYLYPAGMTHLAILLPPEVQAGDLDQMLDRMRQPATRARVLPYLHERLQAHGDPVIGYTRSGRSVGQTLSALARASRITPAEAAYDMILAEDGVEAAILPWRLERAEADAIIERTLSHPRWMAASDGVYDVPLPHPRAYGCFARVLRKYVRERQLLSIEHAVFRLSGFPAQRFGLGDRGRIAAGLAADLVVFDPDTVSDRATWRDPRRHAVGVDWVLVNGQPVIASGAPTGALPGRIVTRSARAV